MVDSGPYCPDRGDLIWADFDPSAGHEQAGKRPALILSQKVFNERVGLAMVVPITSRVRGHGFEVAIEHTSGIEGVVLCQQVKMIDYISRGVTLAGKADKKTIEDILLRIRAILA